MQLKTLIAALIIVSVQPVMWGMEKEPQTKEPMLQIDYEIKESADSEIKKGRLEYQLAELKEPRQIWRTSIDRECSADRIVVMLSCKLIPRHKGTWSQPLPLDWAKYKIKKTKYFWTIPCTYNQGTVTQTIKVPAKETAYFNELNQGIFHKMEFKIIENEKK